MGRFSLPNYDKWKLATPWDDEEIAFTCDQCHEEIYVGDEYLETDDAKLHEDCFDEYAWEALGVSKQYAERDEYYGEDD